MTYVCGLTGAALFEPTDNLTAEAVAAAFAKCVFRSLTVPILLRSDRGQEFRSAIMSELCHLLGITQKFGNRWRPCEQGECERNRRERKHLHGILLADLAQSAANDWHTLLPAVEFQIYNTPGMLNLTPRVLDKQWSIASPLAKDLRPMDIAQEPISSELVRNVFRAYAEVKKLYLLAREKRRRATAHATTSRNLRDASVGAWIVHRDPQAKALLAKTPAKIPPSGPAEVVSVHGNSVHRLTRRYRLARHPPRRYSHYP